MLTFPGITSTVKTSLEESLVQILSPSRRVDILRDAMETKKRGRPYVITFCGVNGVGKSTNLAKVKLTVCVTDVFCWFMSEVISLVTKWVLV